jgi:predicted transcriptional regulator of viral defense system
MGTERDLKTRVVRLARRQGVVRSRDFELEGIHRMALRRLVEAGILERVGRGLYSLPKARVTENHTLVEATIRVPKGIICLLSALQFHKLTTQSPHEVWMAVSPVAWKPTTDWPPLRVVRFSGAALTHGVEKHTLEGVDVRITSPAKTVADAFKYRNKIGLDVALEALADYRKRRGSVDALMKAAAVDRVARVIRPYLEATS